MPNDNYLCFNFFCLGASKRSCTVFLCVAQCYHNSDIISCFQLSQTSQERAYLHLYCSSWLPWIASLSVQAKGSKWFSSPKVNPQSSIPKSNKWMAYLKGPPILLIASPHCSSPTHTNGPPFLLETPSSSPRLLPLSVTHPYPTSVSPIHPHAVHLLLSRIFAAQH